MKFLNSKFMGIWACATSINIYAFVAYAYIYSYEPGGAGWCHHRVISTVS